MPRRNENDILQVIAIILERKNLRNWTFVPIDRKSEEEVAQILKSSAIFLNFSSQEGFGLPPLEALFCGCFVIGYHGQGGKEFMYPTCTTLIENGDILDFAKAIEALASDFERNEKEMMAKGRENAEALRTKYSVEQEESDILNAWQQLTSQ